MTRTGLHRSWPAMPERWPRVSMRSTRRSGPMARASTLRPVRQSRSRFTCYSSAPKPTTRLDAEGCDVVLNGLYMADGRQHVDHHTCIDHAKPRGVSREFYKGVLDGAARAVFNGKVIVRPDAQKTDAHQSNRNLLLSEGAEVDTKPQLEIYADDVKCSHGATVGQLDENQIFYLRSRGVDGEAARHLLVHAFAEEMVSRCGIAP